MRAYGKKGNQQQTMHISIVMNLWNIVLLNEERIHGPEREQGGVWGTLRKRKGNEDMYLYFNLKTKQNKKPIQ